MKFDLVFSNPPYNQSVDIRILQEIVPIANEIVIVHPATWLLNIKGKNSLFENFRETINSHTKSLELFNGNPVFNIDIFVPCVITHIDQKHNGLRSVKDLTEHYSVDLVTDVSLFGSKWVGLVKPFKAKLESYVRQNKSLDDIFNKKSEDFVKEEGKFCFQFPIVDQYR